jgi:methionyl-tRNA formyltransferase
MIKIAIIGQSNFGENVASEISKIDDCAIVGIFTPPNQDKDPLYQFGTTNNINVLRFDKLRSKTAIKEFIKLKVDLLVMAYVTDIVPMEIINNPNKGTIQYHPSLLPKHRGPSSINWAIINGDNSTGITIFWPDEGLDTGPILMQKKVHISPDDTTGTLYFNKLFPIGVESMIDSIKLVISNKAPKIIQDEKKSTYESWCSKKEIDWDKDPDEIYNLIRGCDPQPGAWTKIESKTVSLYNCNIEENNNININKSFIIENKKVSVGLKNKKITLGRIKDEKGKKVNAFEWFEENNFTNNSKLG